MGTYLQYFDNYDGSLPPGFRFHPTDEELITYYLLKKVLDGHFSCRAIAEVDLNKCEPWELPEKAKMGEKEWYFFSLRDRKYPTGLRTNRATEAGYWKATGKDREIYSSKTCCLVGMKKTLVFYRGRAPKGEKTHWVMHEYRLDGKFSYHYLSTNSKDEWVISRVFQKSSGAVAVGGSLKKTCLNSGGINFYPEASSPSCSSLPPLLDSSPFATAASAATANSYDTKEHVPCFSTTNFYPHAPFDPIAAMVDPTSSRFPRNNGGGGLQGFPNLKSLQENLQMPFFSALAPLPVHGGGDMGGCSTFGCWQGPEDQKVDGGRIAVGTNELDCMWGY